MNISHSCTRFFLIHHDLLLVTKTDSHTHPILHSGMVQSEVPLDIRKYRHMVLALHFSPGTKHSLAGTAVMFFSSPTDCVCVWGWGGSMVWYLQKRQYMITSSAECCAVIFYFFPPVGDACVFRTCSSCPQYISKHDTC